jgi:hypothetical protein
MYKKIMFSLLLLPFVFNSEHVHASDDINEKIAYIIVKMTEKSGEIIAGIAIAAGTAAIYSTNSVIKNTYEWWYPTPEQTASTKAARDQIDFLDAKANFKNCFTDSKLDSEKNDNGIPTECEKTARAFIICGGINEVIIMTTELNPRK